MTVMERTRKQLGALCTAWNREKIRRGDRCDANLSNTRVKRKWNTWTHPRSWTLAGTIQAAFRALGKLAPGEAGRRQQPITKVIDAIAGTSLAASDWYNATHGTFISAIQCGALQPPWLLFLRQMDCTPVNVYFGLLQSVLAPVARYWVKDLTKPVGSRWTLVSADERQRSGLALPRTGIIEMLGQAGSVSWPQAAQTQPDFFIVRNEPLLIQSLYLERSNGSTQLAGYNAGAPRFNLSSLISLTASVPIVCVYVGGDTAKSVNRMKMGMFTQIRDHNSTRHASQGVVVFISGECSSRIIQREIEDTCDVKRLIPQMYATAWCASLVDSHTQILNALKAVLAADLRSGFIPGIAPPDQDACAHTRAWADKILPRIAYHKRSLLVDGSPQLLIDEWCNMFNGSIRARSAVHFCHIEGCCGGRKLSACIDKAFDLLYKCVFEDLGSQLPSIIKWYTLEIHAARQTLGQVTHAILPRVTQRAYVGSDNDEAIANGDDFHANSSKRKKQSMEFHMHEDCMKNLGFTTIMSTPMNSLSFDLQEQDHKGGAMFDLTDRDMDRGCLFKCYKEPHLPSLPLRGKNQEERANRIRMFGSRSIVHSIGPTMGPCLGLQ